MQTSQIFNGIYVVQKKISSGSFGVVLLGHDKEKNVDVAIKIEKEENEDVRSLEREVQVLEKLQGTDGVPKLFWHGQQDEFNVIILQLLGKDLSHFIKSKKKFSFKTTIQLGIQIVHVLERIHNKGVVHRDLKPENILFGIEDESSKIYVVDFGISKIYLDAQGNILPFRDNASFIGTTRYASIAAHKGHELSRKDDIESLIYGKGILNYQKSRQLPWQNMQNVSDEERTVKVGEMKMNMDPRELCQDVPPEFANILEHLRQLQYSSEPNYYFVRNQLEKAAENQGIKLDNIYDWDQKYTIFCKIVDIKFYGQLLRWLQQMKISQNIENHDNLQRSTTQQQLQPPASAEMKKSIEKQGSNLIRQLSNNQFLIPPSQLKRQDSQQPSVVSGSVMLSTYNSIRPKYQPSQIAFDAKVCDDNSPQDVGQNMKQTAETGNKNARQNSYAETVGWRDSVFEENFDEIPLSKKYGVLKQKGVAIPKKRKPSQSPNQQKKKQ